MIFKRDNVEEEYKSSTRYSYYNIYYFNIASFCSFRFVNLIGSSDVSIANPICRFRLGRQDVQLVLLYGISQLDPSPLCFVNMKSEWWTVVWYARNPATVLLTDSQVWYGWNTFHWGKLIQSHQIDNLGRQRSLIIFKQLLTREDVLWHSF